jgi:hypothetical protein
LIYAIPAILLPVSVAEALIVFEAAQAVDGLVTVIVGGVTSTAA